MERRLNQRAPLPRRGQPTAPLPLPATVTLTKALPCAQWPLIIKIIARRRRAGDIGAGDTTKHIVGDERSDRFQKWFHRKFGKSCGCASRQRWLNERFPYL